MENVHPREVADKSLKPTMRKAIAMALDVENVPLRHNTQTFNANRYTALKELDDYEELKHKARMIKEHSIEHLPELIAQLTKTIELRGGKVFYAHSKSDATAYITQVCQAKSAKLAVKAKSITSEEIELNRALDDAGIEVAETDLAEFILQVSKEQPSHIVAPAIHRSRERISELFKNNFKTTEPLNTGEDLTKFARDILREKFLSADIGISGANLIAAREGTLLLVESEGNIRLSTHLPAVHIAVAGIEKIIPSKKDFGIFIELLARSATGQNLTSYTNILEPPLPLPVLNLNGRSDTAREFHLVLIDNGRMKVRGDIELRESLYCIRCSACMNVCVNFQSVGGHAFGGECYVGGIGGAWTVTTTGSLAKARFAELCTGCSRCVPNCPVQIDIPGLNTTIKNRLQKSEGTSLQKQLFAHFSLFGKFASYTPVIANWVNHLTLTRMVLDSVAGIDKRRRIPRFAHKTLVQQFNEYRKNNRGADKRSNNRTVILFADVFTNYNNPHVGMAAVTVFDRLGIPTTLGKVLDDGRSAQSQGLIDDTMRKAFIVGEYLENLIDHNTDVIVAEPTVLSMIRHDYKKIIKDQALLYKLENHVFDPIEYLNKKFREGILDLPLHLRSNKSKKIPLFFHGHCQMKTIDAADSSIEFFRNLGYTVEVSSVECCGMAGSFGYKKDYFELSKNIAKDLVRQIKKSPSYSDDLLILASGTSCREQLSDELNNSIYHPIEFLNLILMEGGKH